MNKKKLVKLIALLAVGAVLTSPVSAYTGGGVSGALAGDQGSVELSDDGSCDDRLMDSDEEDYSSDGDQDDSYDDSYGDDSHDNSYSDDSDGDDSHDYSYSDDSDDSGDDDDDADEHPCKTKARAAFHQCVDESKSNQAFAEHFGRDDECDHIAKYCSHALPETLHIGKCLLERAPSHQLKGEGYEQGYDHCRCGVQNNWTAKELEIT